MLGGGGLAFAYWTSTGTGTGTGTTGAGDVALVVNQTSVISDMGPGVAAQDLSGTFDQLLDRPDLCHDRDGQHLERHRGGG